MQNWKLTKATSMASYFDQLVEDIRNAARRKPEGKQRLPDVLVPNEWKEQHPHAEYVVSKKIGEWFGLSRDMFPPAGYWEEDQLEFMAKILTQLYQHFHFDPVMYHPYQASAVMPHLLTYEALLRGFDLYECYNEDGMQSVFLCNQELQSCPFGMHHCFCFHQDWI